MLTLVCCTSFADPNRDALNSAARAFYFQTHLDQDASYLKSKYIDRNFSKQTQEIAAWAIVITQAIQDGYISYKWEFP
jgi:hypothetical protein